ncbi:MAG: gamma carbonic anhydrase family protein [Chloroflexi bacterium]|nr:gamma carbonic anhydrase family protein [Chloroflexota bacterium]
MIRSWKGKTPQVHPTAFVSEAAYVVGEVDIGENSSVWPGTVVRGDRGKITIGKGSNIQDNCTIHSDAPARIGDGCTLGHGVIWHGRLLGDHCLVGNGATANDGVEVGELSVIGAGAVVLENVKVPPRSLVMGIPGKVKGQTTERHHEMIKSLAAHYVEEARGYKREGLE